MLKRLAQLELAIAVALLAVITGLVFVAAIMRFYGHPLIWSVDMAQLLFIWLCFLGANKAMREKSHLGMEVAVKYLGYRPHLWLQFLCAVIVLAFLAVLAVEGYRLTMLNRERTFGDFHPVLRLGDGGRAGGLRAARPLPRLQHGRCLAPARRGGAGLHPHRRRQGRAAAAGAVRCC